MADRLDGDERVVVVTGDGIVVGAVSAGALTGAAADAEILDLLEPSPSTIRPHVPVSELDESAAGVLVTTPMGTLLGAVDPKVASHGAFEDELEEVLVAVHERFGEREPDKEELRTFLHDRLVQQGRTPAEADRVLAEMDEQANASG